MKLLFDTHAAIWAVHDENRFSITLRSLINDPTTILTFSAISIAEIAIKRAHDRDDFPFEPTIIRTALLDAGYEEVVLTGAHALELRTLPPIHRDPFDRMLVAQTRTEGSTLLTADVTLQKYEVPTIAL